MLDKNSPAWNKGRIHYTNAAEDVGSAYAAQFAKDMEIFLDARAKELVVGGMMVLIMPSIPDGIPNSCVPSGVMFDLLGSSLMDMAKEVSKHHLLLNVITKLLARALEVTPEMFKQVYINDDAEMLCCRK